MEQQERAMDSINFKLSWRKVCCNEKGPGRKALAVFSTVATVFSDMEPEDGTTRVLQQI